MKPPPSAQRRRVHARVRGIVQGVGFRPFAFRLATQLRVGGFVRNDRGGVELEAEGEPLQVAEFLRRLAEEAPSPAAVAQLEATEVECVGERTFAIAPSAAGAGGQAPVAADGATCAECLAELRDPQDRRHRYPFITCTACGPRFTIVQAVPYDRASTTMAPFAMCAKCRAEYEDPGDRRFHAEANACPHCGPRARLIAPDGGALVTAPGSDPVAAAATLLAAGAIVAVKGIGGYHLACLAGDERAVGRLRAGKRREDKPFALLAADMGAARELVQLEAEEERLLGGRRAPIVIAPRQPGAQVAAAVAPGSAELGVMLPPSPLHHLLARDVGAPLVLTSGNLAEEPIAHRESDALARLGGLADAFLTHDRPIQVRSDDSVVRSLGRGRGALMLRRSRGYAPEGLALAPPAPCDLLACGAQLKSTFCLARDSRAWVGQHIGDLGDFETLQCFAEGVEHFQRLLSLRPQAVAHDLHPDYLSTGYALQRDGVELIAVQHHHAHLAACLAEHGVRERAVGAIFDGSGYGADGSVWGGEILAGDAAGFTRAGALLSVRMPGGEAAVREPWRMACSWLVAATGEAVPAPPPALDALLGGEAAYGGQWEAVAALAGGAVAGAAPATTSAGRLFDAVAALAGVRGRVSYEGQAAAELEALAAPDEQSAYPLALVWREPSATEAELVLDPRETIRALLADLRGGVPVALVSARFHNALAAAAASACAQVAEAQGLSTAVLSGGVFQNRLLLVRTAQRLRAEGLRVLIPRLLPPNDGAISYGQAAVAAARLAGR